MNFDKNFWDQRYQTNDTAWDLGQVSPPLKHYINGLKDRSVSVLIPGAGNSYEFEYCIQKGFTNVYLLDISSLPIENIKQRMPKMDDSRLICNDFFQHQGQYDLIIEQTFFCALDPAYRKQYVQHMYALLKPAGKLAGVLFNRQFSLDAPPFGGNKTEYEKLFSDLFSIKTMDVCYNSVLPRSGTELFIELIARK